MNTEDITLICGYGVSGKAAARLAVSLGKNIVIADEHDSPEMHAEAGQLRQIQPGLRFFPGWTPEQKLPECGTVIVSPGIRRTAPLYQAAADALIPGGQWLSELEFALRNIHCPFVSITGTNGKTTTTELTTALLRTHGVNAESAGNIGTALSGCVQETNLRKLECLAVETSSFQLENIAAFPACPATVLNLASDHIDRHGSLAEYARTKFKVLTAERPAEQRIINSNLRPWAEKFLPGTEMTTFSADDPDADFTLNTDNVILFHGRAVYDVGSGHLQGIHNAENMMAALAMLRAVRGEDALFRPETAGALKTFRCSPHRMEVFAEYSGIRFVNDSKATNPHAVNAAVRQFARGRNLLVILGGLDKGMDFSELEVSLPHIRQAFLIGRCRDTISAELSGKVQIHAPATFEDAVKQACDAARPGDCVMLSPATASMDMFKNYAERGDVFKSLVRQWIDSRRP